MHSHIIHIHAKHVQNNKDERSQFSRKIYLSLYWKGCVWKGIGDWTELQHSDPPPTLLAIIAFFSRSPGLLNWGPGGPTSAGTWFWFQHLLSNWSELLLPGLYNNLTPTYFLWASHSHSIQPVDSQGHPQISSTGCTRYLHRCISYFDSSAGSKVNIQYCPLSTTPQGLPG